MLSKNEGFVAGVYSALNYVLSLNLEDQRAAQYDLYQFWGDILPTPELVEKYEARAERLNKLAKDLISRAPARGSSQNRADVGYDIMFRKSYEV